MLVVNYEAKGQRPPFFNTSKLQVSCVTAPLKHIIAGAKMYFFHLLLQLVCRLKHCVGSYFSLTKAFSFQIPFKICSSNVI